MSTMRSILIWINNSSFIIVWLLLVPIIGLVLLILTAIFKKEIFLIMGLFYVCITIAGIFYCFLGSGSLANALRGEYGQHLVETRRFYANKNTEELQKIAKGEIQNNVTVWCNKKTYDDVEVKVREGKEEKIVFAYPKPSVKGIKVLGKTPFIYVYHKKSKQPRYRFD
ncbi:hypothetical protein [Lactobacillus taiwanensis]|uniref:hypothetical protein n=1 Tax=Lactobacillus taiwanensis TaxID=508451 RepID=UPI0032200416